MAKNSVHSHEVAVEVTDFFLEITDKVRRKAVARTGKPLSGDSQKRIVQWADREVVAKFGFPMRELFEA